MQIRTRLALQFTAIVALIVLLAFVIIYLLTAQTRKERFYDRLESQSHTAAELLQNDNPVDSALLRLIRRTNQDVLTSQCIIVFDATGNLIFTDNDTIQFELTPDLIKKVNQSKKVIFVEKGLEWLAMSYYVKSKKLFVIAGAIDTRSIVKNEALIQLLIVLFCIIIIIVPITGSFFSKNALKPLTKVISQVNSLPVESIEARIFVSNSKDEIGQLANTFNRLLDKIQNSFELQKIFLSAASHEMKNPLTAITSQLQVLQLRTRTQEEYKETIDSVLEDLGELNKTTINLIEYARLSYEMNIGVSFSRVRIDDILWHCKDYTAKLNPSNTVEIHFVNPPENEEGLIIMGNDSLLKIAFMNLIDNGCKFSNDNKVIIDLIVQKEQILIGFSDNGIGMKPKDQAHIFEPFYRTDNTSGVRGHGLGLSIVKKIMDLHNAKIDIVSKQFEGTSFMLKFSQGF